MDVIYIVNPGIQSGIVNEILRQKGFKVIFGLRNENALNALKEQEIKVVVLDIKDSTTVNVISRLRESYPNQRVIALTPNQEIHDQIFPLCLEAGAESILARPYEPDGLVMLIEGSGYVTSQKEFQKRQQEP